MRLNRQPIGRSLFITYHELHPHYCLVEECFPLMLLCALVLCRGGDAWVDGCGPASGPGCYSSLGAWVLLWGLTSSYG